MITINLNQLKELINTPFSFIKNKNTQVLNIPCAFDIETSNVIFNKGKKEEFKNAFMYAFVFYFNYKYILGRTWDDFLFILDYIEHNVLNKSRGAKAIIYVHNLSFEFQFIKKYINFKNVLSYDERQIIYAESEFFIFKCSYILSGYSLDFIGANILKKKVKKLLGQLDYNLIRLPTTELSDDEKEYIIHDGLIVIQYINEKIESDGNILKIPLTKTGYVRRETKQRCLYDSKNHHGNYNKQFFQYRNLMERLTLTYEDYLQAHLAFHGGFTHGNAQAVNRLVNNVASYDFTSSYPYVLISEEYPMSAPHKLENMNEQRFNFYNDRYLTIFDIEFNNIKCKYTFETPISLSKCIRISDDRITNNGRVVKAKYLKIILTNIDFKIIKFFYSWENCKVSNFKYMLKGYLPKAFILCVLDFYKKKTELKGATTEEEQEEYMNNKEMLNSCYGMMVTNIIKEEIEYNPSEYLLHIKDNSIEEEREIINMYNKKKDRHLYYLWGVFVTAYAQYNLFTAISRIKEDYIYSDTDSVKIMHYEKYQDYFKNYNSRVEEKLKKMCAYHQIDFNLCKPKTRKGVEKLIGVWDFEGVYKRFKTLGAKRYMYEDANNELHMVVSGLNSKVALPYLIEVAKNKNVSAFDLFKDNLRIPSEFTGKLCHTYIDEEFKYKIKDYKGNEEEVISKSCVNLAPIDYNMSMSIEFMRYLDGLHEYKRGIK